MENALIPMTVSKVLQTRTYTALLLGNEEKRFAIYTEPSVGAHIQAHLAEKTPARPFTHMLLQQMLEGLGVKILQVVIQEQKESIYSARLFLEQTQGERNIIIEIDARPSDCIPLAMAYSIPIYCRRELFESVISVEE